MLSIDNLGVEFSGRWLLKDASYQFLPGERIGLIGRNGAGKSTLLRLINGEMSPTEGKIHKAGRIKIAFFNQDLLSYQTERSILDVARDAFIEVLELGKEIDEILGKIEAGEGGPELWDDLAVKQDAFETQGGSMIDAQVHTVLAGLGFSEEEQHRPYHTFSGGWRMRVLLAKMLLAQPDILLLDEPTNHLDLPSIQWLENYLKTFRGTCIVVSHDRFFIDRISDKIVEISLQQLHEYSGNYTFYLAEKALRHEQQKAAYANQQKHIAQQEQFINRFRYKASKARQAQSKIKQLEKLERVKAPEEEHVSLSIRFVMKEKSGKEVLRLKNIQKAYGDNVVINGSNATIMRGDKIALIGANGLGKSTLLRIMTGTEPHTGICETGHNVSPSFFAQHQLEALNLRNTILREVTEASREKTETELRTLLGCFMFSGDESEKKIQVLSGGEKSRVALAKTLLSEANFLLLDEPTNHLDIQSIQILVESLNAYEGTYVVVSHDRFFLQQVANKIWYIEDKQVKEYIGTYDEYEAWRARLEAERQAKEAPPPVKQKAPKVEAKPKPEKKELSFAQRKAQRNRLRKLERKQEELETKIETIEAELAQMELEMGSSEMATDFAKLSAAQTVYDEKKATLDQQTEKWEALVLEIEALGEE